MDCRTAAVVSHREDIVGIGIAGYFPGILLGPFGPIQPDMLGVAVGLGVNNDPVEPQIPATIHDADGYFAAVGDEHLSFHTIPLVKNVIVSVKRIVKPNGVSDSLWRINGGQSS